MSKIACIQAPTAGNRCRQVACHMLFRDVQGHHATAEMNMYRLQGLIVMSTHIQLNLVAVITRARFIATLAHNQWDKIIVTPHCLGTRTWIQFIEVDVVIAAGLKGVSILIPSSNTL